MYPPLHPAWLVLLFVCGCSTSCSPRADVEASRSPAAAQDQRAPAPVPAANHAHDARLLLLGRVVNLQTMQAERTLTDTPPEREDTVASAGLGVLLTEDRVLRAFALTTGNELWRDVLPASCNQLVATPSQVLSLCRNQVFAHAIDDGTRHLLDSGPAQRFVLQAGRLWVQRTDGMLVGYDLATRSRAVSQRLPTLQGMDATIIGRPESQDICVYSVRMVHGAAPAQTYQFGCYDEKLNPRWTGSETSRFVPPARYGVRQLGPNHLVVDGQELDVPDTARPGFSVRWRDGQVTHVDELVFATLDDASGERIPNALGLFDQDVDAHPEHDRFHVAFARDEAVVVYDRARGYGVVQKSSPVLFGVDLAEQRRLFLVPVPLSGAWQLDLAGGHPLVRSYDTEAGRGWDARIYSATTGELLYRDRRARR